MSFRRLVVIVLSAAGILVLGILAYLAFGDLSRHKGRIEALVAKHTGRPFAIDGDFELEVLPSVSVVAEKVRLGNAEWGSEPQMVEVGRLSTEVGLWSLVSGPIDIRSLELRDVSVVLEKDEDGKGNWALGGGAKPAEEEEGPPGPGVTEVPAVVEQGTLSNIRLTWREPGKPDRVAQLDTLTIGPGVEGLLAIAGKGRLDDYETTIDGEVGPLDALFSGRDIRLALKAAVGNLGLDARGVLGRLNPLDGADLTLKVENPDLGTMLENLHLPVVATGQLRVEARLKDAGDLTQVDVDAALGDIEATSTGTIRTLGLPGSDLRFEVEAKDAARLAAVFEVQGVPADVLQASGHVVSSREEIRIDGLSAKLAGAEAKVDGTVRVARPRRAQLQLAASAPSLARLREGLPEIAAAARVTYEGRRDGLELKDLEASFGESEISGWARVVAGERRRIEVELASPRLDLTPFMKKEEAADTGSEEGTAAAATPVEGGTEPPAPAPAEPAGEPKSEEPEKRYVFGEEPLPLDMLETMDVKAHLVSAEVEMATGVLNDVDATVIVDGGQLLAQWGARGIIEGTLNGSLTLVPAGDGGAADLNLDVALNKVHAGLTAGGEIDPSEAPEMNLEATLRARGASPREMASGANGKVLVSQGPGKVKSGLVAMFGGDIVGQLAGKLNPFSADDPFTQLDCTVARVDIVDGHLTVKPVLMQSEKVTVTAGGKVDLHTEELLFDFNTRPRKGIGITAGMFTNPFIKLDGTLAHPRLGVGAKGAASGALAGLTAGVSVLAKGLVDRIAGEADLCDSTLEQATRATPPEAAAKESGGEKPR